MYLYIIKLLDERNISGSCNIEIAACKAIATIVISFLTSFHFFSLGSTNASEAAVAIVGNRRSPLKITCLKKSFKIISRNQL